MHFIEIYYLGIIAEVARGFSVIPQSDSHRYRLIVSLADKVQSRLSKTIPRPRVLSRRLSNGRKYSLGVNDPLARILTN